MSILKGLAETSILERVVTTLAGGSGRRAVPDFLKGRVRSIWFRETIRLLVTRLGNDHWSDRIWLWSELGFDEAVARRHAGKHRGVYGMEHSSLETFKRQKEAGGLCALRQVMAHARTVVDVHEHLGREFPEWNLSPRGRLFRGDIERSLRRKEEEYRLADLIVVNSDFAKETFTQAGVDGRKIFSIPTGCPAVSESKNGQKSPGTNRPLIFIYVGALSLRKGVPYLLKAWRAIKPGKSAELWLVGGDELPARFFEEKLEGVKRMGRLSGPSLEKIYRQADVLVLPTLLEGFAHVIVEALAFGLAVITTKESGSGPLVIPGQNGFIVEAGNAEALAQAMEACLKDPARAREMGRASREIARGWTVDDSNKAHLAVIKNWLGVP